MENAIKNNIDFLIIDGDSFIHRAYHGYKKVNNDYTEHNIAIKGFTEMISRVINKYQSKYIALVFDHQGTSFRHDVYPEYKGNRPPKELHFLKQIEDIHTFSSAIGLPIFCIENFEADDTIGALARKSQKLNWNTVILTGDKDLAQLVDQKTIIIDTKKDKEINLGNLESVFGVNKPHQIIELLALKGDKADNILGMKDCGEKTAIKLIQKYDTINELIKADPVELYDYIKPIIRQKAKAESIVKQVVENPDSLLLWQYLTSLNIDVGLNLTMKDIKINPDRMSFDLINQIRFEYNLNLKKSIPLIIKKHIA